MKKIFYICVWIICCVCSVCVGKYGNSETDFGNRNSPAKTIEFSVDEFYGRDIGDTIEHGLSSALAIVPQDVDLSSVRVGENVKEIITIRAVKIPIVFDDVPRWDVMPRRGDPVLSGSCFDITRLNVNEGCTIEFQWRPMDVRNIDNRIRLVWRENNPSVFKYETSFIPVRIQSIETP